MDTFERDAARQLAVSYNAYMEYHDKPDCESARRFWGKMLLEAQRKTGIELLSSVSVLYSLADDDGARKATVAGIPSTRCVPISRKATAPRGAQIAADTIGSQIA